jgi:hypothetical protein
MLTVRENHLLSHEISGSHSFKYEDDVLGCCAVYFNRCIQKFHRCLTAIMRVVVLMVESVSTSETSVYFWDAELRISQDSCHSVLWKCRQNEAMKKRHLSLVNGKYLWWTKVHRSRLVTAKQDFSGQAGVFTTSRSKHNLQEQDKAP